MNIIEEAGHPIYTGVVPLGKGHLLDEAKSEHFTKDFHNEEMLIRLIYDSNMLTSFLALWKHVPPDAQNGLSCRTKSTKCKGCRW